MARSLTRSQELRKQRNEKIKERYHELMNTGRRGNRRRVYADDVLAQLEKEFFITSRTILDIIYAQKK